MGNRAQTAQLGAWYQVDTRPGPGQERAWYEADLWELEGHQPNEFGVGSRVSGWRGEGWFGVSSPEMEGPLEDVIKTANLLPVFSERLKAALEANGVEGIQFLPVKTLNARREPLGSYYLANVLAAVPALDEQLSGVRRRSIRLRDGTTKEWVHWVNKYVLRGAALFGHQVVVVPGLSHDTFVSERFRTVFEANRFTGIGFRPVEVV